MKAISIALDLVRIALDLWVIYTIIRGWKR